MNWKFWKRPKNISEPVFTLFNEIAFSYDNWEYDDGCYRSSGFYFHKLIHVNRIISVKFCHMGYNDYKCLEEMFTRDEQRYLGKAFSIWYKKYKESLYLKKQNYDMAERQRILKELQK